MVAASLLGFYREGWEPMTPIDTAAKADKRGGQVRTINTYKSTDNLHISIHKISITPSLTSGNPVILKLNAQTSICFRRREDSKIGGQQSSSMAMEKPFGSTLSLASWASRHWLWSNPPIQWFSWTGTAQWNACASRHAGSHKIFKLKKWPKDQTSTKLKPAKVRINKSCTQARFHQFSCGSQHGELVHIKTDRNMSSSPPEILCMGDQPMFDMSDLFQKVLHSIIARLMKDWSPGVRGVSKNLLFNNDGKL